MRQPPSNVCPLLLIAGIGSFDSPAVCIEERCAWWNYPGCIMSGTVEELGNIACGLDDIARVIKSTPVSAANADEGAVEQNLPGTVSTSNITENGGFVK